MVVTFTRDWGEPFSLAPATPRFVRAGEATTETLLVNRSRGLSHYHRHNQRFLSSVAYLLFKITRAFCRSSIGELGHSDTAVS